MKQQVKQFVQRHRKTLTTAATMGLMAGSAFAQSGGGAGFDITSAGSAAVSTAGGYVLAAGGVGLAFWGLRAPIKAGLKALASFGK